MKRLASTVSYEVTDPTVDSQIIQIRNSGAEIFFGDTAPKAFARRLFGAADVLLESTT